MDQVTPADDIAIWEANYHSIGPASHGAYVTAVSGDGSITVDDAGYPDGVEPDGVR